MALYLHGSVSNHRFQLRLKRPTTAIQEASIIETLEASYKSLYERPAWGKRIALLYKCQCLVSGSESSKSEFGVLVLLRSESAMILNHGIGLDMLLQTRESSLTLCENANKSVKLPAKLTSTETS